jgi:hypothetical protein
VNAGSDAVRVVAASVPPADVLGEVRVVGVVAVVVVVFAGAGALEVRAGALGLLAVLALEPHAQSVAAQAASAGQRTRCIG